MQTVLARQAFGAVVVGRNGAAVFACTGEHFAHQAAVPSALHQLRFGNRRCGRFADDANELVNIRQRYGQAFQHVATVACFTQGVDGAASDHFAAVLQEHADQVFQVA